jgi:hypothetical protein
VPHHKTTTISKTANISYKLCTQEKMDWSEPKENKTKKKSKALATALFEQATLLVTITSLYMSVG